MAQDNRVRACGNISMTLEEALQILDEVLRQDSLSNIQEMIFRYSWEGRKYPDIAETLGYDSNYIKDVGAKLWKLLSQAFGEEVTKSNFRSILAKNARRLQSTKTEPATTQSVAPIQDSVAAVEPPSRQQRIDWGDAIDIPAFCGRQADIETLAQWILGNGTTAQPGCRMVALLGLGGIGKTALAIKVAEQVQDQFAAVIWRSLRHGPSLAELLEDVLRCLQTDTIQEIPETLTGRMSRLSELLRAQRCLLILDNAESLLRSGDPIGRYLEGYESYGEWLQLLGSSRHQSCIILTSREKPKELMPLEGEGVRSWVLAGLSYLEGQTFLQQQGTFQGKAGDWQRLIQQYGGNPLELKIVAQTLQDLFDGNLAAFLSQGRLVFDDIGSLLEQQLQRLSDLERQILYWLAIAREAVSLQELQGWLMPFATPVQILEGMRALGRRSLVEKQLDEQLPHFTLQSVVMEYMTEQLVMGMSEEIAARELLMLRRFAILPAYCKEYIHQSQTRLILKPLLEQLQRTIGTVDHIKKVCYQLLQALREAPQPGYAPSNLLNLLLVLGENLSQQNLAGLTLRQADLRSVSLHRVNFAHAQFDQVRFASTLNAVLDVAISPDQRWFATGDVGGVVRLWSVTEQTQIFTLQGHTNWVWSVAFTPDGRSLLSASEDQTLRIWDCDSGACLQTLVGHTGRVWAVICHPDGKTCASSSADRTVRIWDIASGTCLQVLDDFAGEVLTLAYSPKGTQLLTAGEEATVRYWDLVAGTTRQIEPKQRGWLWSGVWLSEFEIACGGDDGQLWVWDLDDETCIAQWQTPSRIWAIAPSADGRLLATGHDDQTVRIWDRQTQQCLRTFTGHQARIWDVDWRGELLISGSEDQTVRLWNSQSGQCLQSLRGYTNWVCSVGFGEEQHPISAYEDGTIRIWTQSQHLPQTLTGHRGQVWAIASHPQSPYFASSGEDQTVRLWNAQTGRCEKVLQGHSTRVWTVALSPTGQQIASGSGDRTVKLWDVATGQCSHTCEGHGNRVWALAYSTDGAMLASGGCDRSIKLWDAQTGDGLRTLAGHDNWVLELDFHPHNAQLVSAGADGTLRFWDVQTGRLLKTWTVPTRLIWGVAFSPDGQYLATGSDDRLVRIWDVKQGTCLQTLSGHTGWVWSVAFSPDGQQVVSGSQDGTLRRWQVSTGTVLDVMRVERPYEGMNIYGAKGLTPAQRNMLIELGAIEEPIALQTSAV
jgi:WD40 repeat protein